MTGGLSFTLGYKTEVANQTLLSEGFLSSSIPSVIQEKQHRSNSNNSSSLISSSKNRKPRHQSAAPRHKRTTAATRTVFKHFNNKDNKDLTSDGQLGTNSSVFRAPKKSI